MTLILVISLLSILQSDHVNVDRKGLAIQGYDPVSYFSGKATKGLEANIYVHKGVTYYFISQENKKSFSQEPDRYLPQYGGWCAYALGLGPDKVKVNPETFKIIDGKLFLFYNFKGTNTLLLWNEDETSLKGQADINWEKIIK